MSSGKETKVNKVINKFKKKFIQSEQGLQAPSKEVIVEFARVSGPISGLSVEYLEALSQAIDNFKGSKVGCVIDLQQKIATELSGMEDSNKVDNSSIMWTKDAMSVEFYQEFLEMNQGKEEISGTGQSWTKTISWLESKVLTGTGIDDKKLCAIIWACIMISEKPVLWLVNGRTGQSNKGDGIKWNPKMMLYIPSLTAEEIASYDDESRQRFEEARNKYMVEEFRNINISMCRRIAFVALEHLQNCDFVPVAAWYSKYKSRPSMMTKSSLMKLGITNKTTRHPDGIDSYGKAVKGTLDIKVEQIQKFVRDKHHWAKKQAFIRMFGSMGRR